MAEPLLTYGLSGDKLIPISEAPLGLACKCICPECKMPLVAKNNPDNIRTAHFAHSSGHTCKGALESALHLLAKQVLQECKGLRLPAFHHDYNPLNKQSLFQKSMPIVFDKVLLEQAPSGILNHEIRADAIGLNADGEIAIEFAHTHFAGKTKKATLEATGICCIEINLEGQTLNKESLEQFFLSESENIYWLNNPRLMLLYREQEMQKAEERKKRVKQIWNAIGNFLSNPLVIIALIVGLIYLLTKKKKWA